VVLGWPQLPFVNGCRVVQNLEFHANVGCVSSKRTSNTNTVVSARIRPELKTEHEVRVLFLSEQISTSISRTDQKTIFDNITRSDSFDENPAVQTLAVKQRDKAGLLTCHYESGEKECKGNSTLDIFHLFAE